MEKIINVLSKYADLEEQYQEAVYNSFLAGEEFVNYLDSEVFANKRNNPYNRAGYCLSELIEIAKYYGITVIEESQREIIEEVDCYTELSIMPDLSIPGKQQIKVYTNGVRMYPTKVNLAILIYLNCINKSALEFLMVRGNNILDVDFLIKAFTLPMLCRKEEYLKIIKDYCLMFDEKYSGPATTSGLIEQDISTRLAIPLDYARYVIDIYNLVLTKENEPSYLECTGNVFGGFSQSNFKKKIFKAEENIKKL